MLFPLALLLSRNTSLANPLPQTDGITLSRRLVQNYVDCTDDQKKKLNSAFADAATLASNAFDIDTSSKS